jgi:hypothetical protein
VNADSLPQSLLPAVRQHEQHARRNTRKGKQVLNVMPPDNARANAMVEGELTGPENFEAGHKDPCLASRRASGL